MAGNALIAALQAGPTNADPSRRGDIASGRALCAQFARLPDGPAGHDGAHGARRSDPFVPRWTTFHIPPALQLGNVAVLLQPARGYDRDAGSLSTDLVPPHTYLAAYLWRAEGVWCARADPITASTVRWNGCRARRRRSMRTAIGLLWGELPHLYPFIVNDPAVRRRNGARAVIIDIWCRR